MRSVFSRRLYKTSERRLTAFYSPPLAPPTQRIQDTLELLHDLNARSMAEFAWQHMFSGWRQILEVTLTSTRSADGTDRAVNLRLFDMLSHEVCVWHQI